MYLGIRTDSPIANLYLYKGNESVAHTSWQADRDLAKHLLTQLETFLSDNDQTFGTLQGLFIYKGPGSFTGLRIGATVMNTLAYSLSIPIVGEISEDWDNVCIKRLIDGQNDTFVLPHYGADPRITTPKK